jgi:hypothetical protein
VETVEVEELMDLERRWKRLRMLSERWTIFLGYTAARVLIGREWEADRFARSTCVCLGQCLGKAELKWRVKSPGVR